MESEFLMLNIGRLEHDFYLRTKGMTAENAAMPLDRLRRIKFMEVISTLLFLFRYFVNF